MKQVTLVTLYGQKRKQFKELINSIWKEIESSELRRIFKPYDMSQIHATITGMEKLIGFDQLYNANIWDQDEEKVEMNFSSFFETTAGFFPMNVQVGGFDERFREFISMGDTPHNRSFKFYWDSKKVVLIGWSMDNGKGIADHKPENFRQALNDRHNIRSKMEKDNDLYMVIGELINLELFTDEELDQLKNAADHLEKKVRHLLANQPIKIPITLDEVQLIQYQTTSLELKTSEAYNIRKIQNDIEFLKNLYS